MYPTQRQYIEREEKRRWREPQATVTHSAVSQDHHVEYMSSTSSDTYASSDEEVTVVHNRSVTFPVAKPRGYSHHSASYERNDEHDSSSKSSVNNHNAKISTINESKIHSDDQHNGSFHEEQYWRNSQHSVADASRTWRYGLMQFYNDIAYTSLVALLPFVAEFYLVKKYSNLKLALVALLLFFLPIIVAIIMLIIIYYCWLAPLDMVDVVIMLCIFVVILTVCILGRTAILAKTRKDMRKTYHIDDNGPNDVCTVFWCYPFSLCQMLQEEKHQKFSAKRSNIMYRY